MAITNICEIHAGLYVEGGKTFLEFAHDDGPFLRVDIHAQLQPLPSHLLKLFGDKVYQDLGDREMK